MLIPNYKVWKRSLCYQKKRRQDTPNWNMLDSYPPAALVFTRQLSRGLRF
jgi:hypothetical protein